jgi:hypothetical protein
VWPFFPTASHCSFFHALKPASLLNEKVSNVFGVAFNLKSNKEDPTV